MICYMQIVVQPKGINPAPFSHAGKGVHKTFSRHLKTEKLTFF